MEENAFKVTLNVIMRVCVQSPVLYQSCCGRNNIQPLGGATDQPHTHTHDAACALVCVRRVSHWAVCSHVSCVAALQVPEPAGDVHSHGRGVGRLPGVGVGRREQSDHQQLQEAEPHCVRDRRHGRQLPANLFAGKRHGVYDCNHFASDL